MNDKGALEPEPVAGRAADDWNVLERHLQSGDERLLAPAQAVDQENAEYALGLEARPRGGEARAQRFGQLAARFDLEIGEVENGSGDEDEVPPQEADRDYRAFAPALGGDLAGGGAADDRRRAEAPSDLGGEGRDVVIGGDEHDESGEVVRRELAGDVGGCGVGAAAPG